MRRQITECDTSYPNRPAMYCKSELVLRRQGDCASHAPARRRPIGRSADPPDHHVRALSRRPVFPHCAATPDLQILVLGRSRRRSPLLVPRTPSRPLPRSGIITRGLPLIDAARLTSTMEVAAPRRTGRQCQRPPWAEPNPTRPDHHLLPPRNTPAPRPPRARRHALPTRPPRHLMTASVARCILRAVQNRWPGPRRLKHRDLLVPGRVPLTDSMAPRAPCDIPRPRGV